MIIAVDFDGTLCENCYPEIGELLPNAKQALEEMISRGHYVIIWTSRWGQPLLDAINWLVAQDIPFSRVNDHNPENVALYGEGGKKVFADVYIDDKNLGGFDGWAVTLAKLRKMPEY